MDPHDVGDVVATKRQCFRCLLPATHVILLDGDLAVCRACIDMVLWGKRRDEAIAKIDEFVGTAIEPD